MAVDKYDWFALQTSEHLFIVNVFIDLVGLDWVSVNVI